MERMEQMEQTGGNTKTPVYKCRRWCITLNNYTNDEMEQMTQDFEMKGWNYIIGEEIGKNGTKHLQIYIETKNPIRFTSLKKLNERMHIEKARGNREKNLTYCKKEGKFISNFPLDEKEEILEDEYKDVVWKNWQKEILDLILKRPDRRKIHWYWERNGNIGKSYLAKYIKCIHKGVISCEGKQNDIFNQILTKITKDKVKPSIILVDVPRSSIGFINYGCIEKLKNGDIYSGKYEGGDCLFKIPHIIVFANEQPDYTAWSSDRYDVREISQ